jgi:hypothetical protein
MHRTAARPELQRVGKNRVLGPDTSDWIQTCDKVSPVSERQGSPPHAPDLGSAYACSLWLLGRFGGKKTD